MLNKNYISHRTIIDYLQNNLNDRDMRRLNNIRKKDQVYALLFNLIDNCKTKLQFANNHKLKSKPVSFSVIEKLLLNLLSGSFNSYHASNFIYLLQESPDFYNRLMVKLDTINVKNSIKVNEISGIRVKSDTELLTEITAFVKNSSSFPKVVIMTLTNKLTNLLSVTHNRKRKTRLSFIIASIILLCLISYMVFKPGQLQHEIYNKYFSTETVPFTYDSTLRGPLESADQSTTYNTLLSQFKLGIGDYLRKNYTTAVETFDRILTTALSQQNKIDSKRLYPLLREVYFYSGISQLALAGEVKFKRHSLLNKASTLLNNAKELAKIHNLKGGDRENFFLSLTYDLLGEKELALEQLEHIPADSQFRSASEKLKDLLNQ